MIRVSAVEAELPAPTRITSPSPADANGAMSRPRAMLESSTHFPCPRRDERSLCIEILPGGSLVVVVRNTSPLPGVRSLGSDVLDLAASH
jgi:hypothetical protein